MPCVTGVEVLIYSGDHDLGNLFVQYSIYIDIHSQSPIFKLPHMNPCESSVLYACKKPFAHPHVQAVPVQILMLFHRAFCIS